MISLITNSKAFDKETVGFKEGGTISSEEETVDVKNGKEFGEIFETRFNPGRHRNFASQFKPGVKENSANRFRSGGKKDFYAGLKNEGKRYFYLGFPVCYDI